MVRAFLCCLLLSGLTGCAPMEDVVLDGGVGMTGPPRELSVESRPTLELTYAQAAEISVRLTSLGEPVAGVAVRFALEGNAQDSTLDTLEQVSDPDGHVATRLVAGSTGAVFRVRVSAERAPPIYVDVSVGNEGFGGLRVHAPYRGERAIARRVLDLYADVPCGTASAFPRFPARTVALTDPDAVMAEFRTLSAGLLYTIAGRVEGPDGTTLAGACVDSISITRDSQTEVALDFEDAALLTDGTYEVALTVQSDLLQATSALTVAASAELTGERAAPLFLDALGVDLAARDQTDALARLMLDRDTGVAETSLANRLDRAGTHPAAAIARLTATLFEPAASVALAGPLRLSQQGNDAAWTANVIRVGLPAGPDEPSPLMFSAQDAGIAPMPALEIVRNNASDALTVNRLTATLPLGTLWASTLAAATTAAGGVGPALGVDAGCPALAMWITESPVLRPACDPACAERACYAALDTVFTEVTAAAEVADAERHAVSLSGVLLAHDDDGDLTVDRIQGELDGVWSGASSQPDEAITAAFDGRRPSAPE